jgi:hypothetical protein
MKKFFERSNSFSVVCLVCLREDFSTFLCVRFLCEKTPALSHVKKRVLFFDCSLCSSCSPQKAKSVCVFPRRLFDFSPCALSREKLLFFEMKTFFERSNASPCLLLRVFLTRDEKKSRRRVSLLKTRESSLLLFFSTLCQKIEENF